MKYHPDTPERFGSLEDARGWARGLFAWYNQEHHHTGLALLTPAQVHQGLTQRVLAARKRVLAAAYAKHPERFVRGEPSPPAPPSEVWINPPQRAEPESVPVASSPAPRQPDAGAVSRGDSEAPLDTVPVFGYPGQGEVRRTPLWVDAP